MSTPLFDAVEEYVAKGAARFHMPGHKGRGEGVFADILPYDITEVAGADSLFESEGPIAETEREFAALYGAGASLLSAGGSTLCIQTMLTLALPEKGMLIIGRGCHRSAVNAMALLDITPVWLLGQTPEEIEGALAANPEAGAVYITSPDYYGVLADVAACSKICHEHKAVLIIDNAHGAHLKFTPQDLHPMSLGADMCADSLHKSLPVMTGGALLHLRDGSLRDRAKDRMALFGSSSPSYPVMLSAESCIDYLKQRAGEDFARLSARLEGLRALARERGLAPIEENCEPARLSLSVSASGLTAEQFGSGLREGGIEPEYVNSEWAVLMASPFNSEEDFSRAEKFLLSISGSGEAQGFAALSRAPKTAMTLREAVFSPSELVWAEEAEGRIAASLAAPCPPCIAIAAPGETINTETIKLFKKYGVKQIKVVR